MTSCSLMAVMMSCSEIVGKTAFMEIWETINLMATAKEIF